MRQKVGIDTPIPILDAEFKVRALKEVYVNKHTSHSLHAAASRTKRLLCQRRIDGLIFSFHFPTKMEKLSKHSGRKIKLQEAIKVA